MFDDSNETCWNSDQGTSQYILLEFDEEVCVSNISLIFFTQIFLHKYFVVHLPLKDLNFDFFVP
jgi:hypothetical protein